MGYDLTQSLLMLSFAAGRAEKVWGTDEQIADFFAKALGRGGRWRGEYGTENSLAAWDITGFLDTFGAELIGGDWEIVWGPAVYTTTYNGKAERTLANAMFVAHSPSNKMYVVSIAGTNFASAYAQQVEDYNLSDQKMVYTPLNIDAGSTVESQFKPVDTRRPQLGTGTAIGLHILCTKLVHGGKTIVQFLNGLRPPRDTQIVVAGHSLGGTLAPVLASTLYNKLEYPWDARQMSVLASAGASPGNDAFAVAWREMFRRWTYDGASANNEFKYLNTLYWNRYDPVPYGWDRIDYWYYWDPKTPNQMRTTLGRINDENCPQIAADYAAKATMGTTCGMKRLHNATELFGEWPICIWYQGNRVPYQKPAQFGSYQEYLLAVSTSHMGQYLQCAGIDPCAIAPFVRAATT